MGRSNYLLTTVVIVVLGLSNRVEGSCEQHPCNVDICGDSLQCKKNVAGGQECHQRKYCNDSNAFYCSDDHAARRAGMLCDGWPYYNGGYPMSSLHWDDENELYECKTFNGTGASGFCGHWESRENSPDEAEFGECTCAETSINGRYCQRWNCEQEEFDKCDYGEWCTSCHPTLGCNYCYRCRGTDSDGYSYSYRVIPEEERSDCHCIQASTNGNYCDTWYCYEYSPQGHGPPEDEYYYCREEDATGNFCSEWDGLIDGAEEFEFSQCSCTQTHSSGICGNWRCYEKGMNYFYPNLFWSLLSTIFGAPAALYLTAVALDEVNQMNDSGMSFFCRWTGAIIIYIVWAGGWTILCVWLGGLNVLVITLAVHLGPLILYFLGFILLLCVECVSKSRGGSAPWKNNDKGSSAYETEIPAVRASSGGADSESLPVATATAVAYDQYAAG